MNQALTAAQKLFDQGNYRAAFDAACKITAPEGYGEDLTRSFLITKNLLIAKSALNIIHPLDRDAHKLFFQTVDNTIALTRNLADFWRIEKELLESLHDWADKTYRAELTDLINNPTLPTRVENIFSIPVEHIKIANSVSFRFKIKEIIEALCQAEGVDPGDYQAYKKENTIVPCGYLTLAEKFALEYEAASVIFENGKKAFGNMAHASMEYIQANYKDIFKAFTTAQVIVDDYDEDKSAEIRIKLLKLHSEIIRFMLEAVVYPNGRALSLLSDENSRRNYLRKLQTDYTKLVNLDPSFVAPPLPSETPVDNTKGGGCYVATAVYGSYDCPQVWTLRRFRDYTLAETWYGRVFIRTYYAISPTLVKWFGHTEWFKYMWKGYLDRIVANLNADGVEDTPYEDKNW